MTEKKETNTVYFGRRLKTMNSWFKLPLRSINNNHEYYYTGIGPNNLSLIQTIPLRLTRKLTWLGHFFTRRHCWQAQAATDSSADWDHRSWLPQSHAKKRSRELRRKTRSQFPKSPLLMTLNHPYIYLVRIYIFEERDINGPIIRTQNAQKIKKVGTLQTRLGGPKGVPFDGILCDITFGGFLALGDVCPKSY